MSIPSDSWFQDKIGFVPTDETKSYIRDLNEIAEEANNILNEMTQQHYPLEEYEVINFVRKEMDMILNIYDNVNSEQDLINNIDKVYKYIEKTGLDTVEYRHYKCLLCMGITPFIILTIGYFFGFA